MKINNDRSTFEPEATQRSEGAKSANAAGRSQAGAAGASSGDRVALSSDAALVAGAIRDAEQVPAMREDRIAEVRAKMAAGKLADSETIADRMIDHLLGS